MNSEPTSKALTTIEDSQRYVFQYCLKDLCWYSFNNKCRAYIYSSANHGLVTLLMIYEVPNSISSEEGYAPDCSNIFSFVNVQIFLPTSRTG